MKKLALLLVSFSIVVAGCYGQSDKKGQPATSVQPKANIKVNKEYDKNGTNESIQRIFPERLIHGKVQPIQETDRKAV
ncbi:MAG: hypothetical protein KBG04_08295 [Bacteroidales bacterium]|jgi:hypothetical protein|nr:hypothetical protein [Bacteroidales bacterium]